MDSVYLWEKDYGFCTTILKFLCNGSNRKTIKVMTAMSGKENENQAKLSKNRTFDIWFCVAFDLYYQKLIFVENIGH